MVWTSQGEGVPKSTAEAKYKSTQTGQECGANLDWFSKGLWPLAAAKGDGLWLFRRPLLCCPFPARLDALEESKETLNGLLCNASSSASGVAGVEDSKGLTLPLSRCLDVLGGVSKGLEGHPIEGVGVSPSNGFSEPVRSLETPTGTGEAEEKRSVMGSTRVNPSCARQHAAIPSGE